MSDIVTNHDGMRWHRIDLHLHTPASEDYLDKNVSFLDILREAERCGLEIIGLTDHNSIAGYEAMLDEIDFLERLEARGRLDPQEQRDLADYRRLMAAILVLPGFELTTRFGAHVLGLFSPDIPNCVARLKATLHQLGISYERMALGTTSVPGTQAYLEAYKIINEAGGIVIAAHIGSPTGILAIANNMPTGAARVSATQSPYLHALEFASFHSTQLQGFASPRWYDGTNLGYERRMHCIQNSDAHRLVQSDEGAARHLGIGDRPFEALLPERSFEALKALFLSDHFDRIRVPYISEVTRHNQIADVRAGGSSDFHVLCPSCMDDLGQVCRHMVALANGGGGAIYLGIDPDPDSPLIGVPDAPGDMRALQAAIADQVFPRPEWSVDILPYQGKEVVRIEVQEAEPRPCYMLEEDRRHIYVRRDGETVLATHDEIIDLWHATARERDGGLSAQPNGRPSLLTGNVEQPRSGVEVVGEVVRGETEFFRVIDLRTGRESQTSEHLANSVWLYAISAHKAMRKRTQDLSQQARWRDQIGLWRIYRDNEIYDQHGRVKCDLLFRGQDHRIERIFYAVAVSWLGSGWHGLFEAEAPAGASAVALPRDRPVRWRGNLGMESLYRTPNGLFCNLVFRDRSGDDLYYRDVPCAELEGEWRDLLAVELPRSGLEVVEVHENGTGPMYKFHNLGNRHVESRLWTPDMLKEGSLRHYALRMYIDHDLPLDDSAVDWVGNIGCLRRSYTTADLVYRDPAGVDHIYYGARWNDLNGDWINLLER